MKRSILVVLGILMLASPTFANDEDSQKREQDRLRNVDLVMQEILKVPDNIPQDLLDKARCVIVMPSVLKAAFVVGGSYGRGTMVCRTGKDFSGPWGAPAMYALEGGSVGFQIGGEATDVGFLVMNNRGANSLLHSKVRLGADASAAAGPVGRLASVDTDAYMRSEILSYSRVEFLQVSRSRAQRCGRMTSLIATYTVVPFMPLRLSTDRRSSHRLLPVI